MEHVLKDTTARRTPRLGEDCPVVTSIVARQGHIAQWVLVRRSLVLTVPSDLPKGSLAVPTV